MLLKQQISFERSLDPETTYHGLKRRYVCMMKNGALNANNWVIVALNVQRDNWNQVAMVL